jgi:ATP-binding cassette, subfamily C, bacterial
MSIRFSSAFLTMLLGVLHWRAGLIIGCMVARSLTDGLGIILLVPLLQQIGLDVQPGNMGRLADWISGAFAAVGLYPTLPVVLLTYFGVASMHAALGYWQETWAQAARQAVLIFQRERLYRAIVEAKWHFLASSRLSDFTHALTAELDRVGDAVEYLLTLGATLAVTTVYLILAMQLSAPVTGLVVAVGSVLLLLLRASVQAGRRSGLAYSAASRDLYSATIEHFAGLKTVKSYAAEARHIAAYAALSKHVGAVYLDAVQIRGQGNLWFNLSAGVIFCLTLYVALEVFAVSGSTVILLIIIFARLMPRVSNIQQLYHLIVSRLPSFQAVVDLQARCESATEVLEAGSPAVSLTREIIFEDVTFAYTEAQQPAVKHLDLRIKAGETTAIVGPSGAGKSTIADLMIGLLQPSRGRVLIDGIPLRAGDMAAWRDQIGYVAQETFLFHDTVRANLAWAQPGTTDAEIWRALSLAAAQEFVSELPARLDTVLGDRGIRLSGGERQRLALARAMLRQPTLLILDEATSSLDSENEGRIQSAIEALHGQLTIFVITHRLATIRGADTIYVIDQGCVVECGSWEHLAARSDGPFARVLSAQDLG